MIELGKMQTLVILREKDFGVYLGEPGDEEHAVLLPKKQVPQGAAPGDSVEVFIYRDSKDRLIATTAVPKIQVGQTAVLPVKEVAKIGAFLDMGLEKDLLLPFREQSHKVRPGENCLVALYVDKSGRLAATMKVYPYMSADSPYSKDDRVEGTVYEISQEFGAFVAVDDKYSGLIRRKEFYGNVRIGERVSARVTSVKEDGKLDLSLREKAYLQIAGDAERVMAVIDSFDGALPFNDKANPEVIRREMQMSKNEFKRAVGNLLKNGRIIITETGILRKES